MNHAVRGLKLTFCLALLSAGLTFAQSTSTEVVPAVTAAPVAHVYVGTTKGIYLYDAATTGKLTLVSGSPFKTPAGLLTGVTGNYLITTGTYLVHSYQLYSTGAVEKSISSIDTREYYGGDGCGYGGGTYGYESLNHTGRNVYVAFPVNSGSCAAAIQTYNISTTGKLTFNGGIMTGDNAGSGLMQSPAIMANDTFAYAASDFECCGGDPPQWMGYILGSNGEMQNWSFNLSNMNVTLPVGYDPFYVTADPTNHLAAIVAINTYFETYSAPQLASYTVDAHGDLTTTSTAANMPYTSVATSACCRQLMSLNLSPSGKVLAVAGPLGLQLFHFNGAAPITPYSAVLTTAEIDRIHWDNSNHLFALSDLTHQLYVFTVTPTTITKVVGSPFAIPATPNALIVVPK